MTSYPGAIAMLFDDKGAQVGPAQVWDGLGGLVWGPFDRTFVAKEVVLFVDGWVPIHIALSLPEPVRAVNCLHTPVRID